MKLKATIEGEITVGNLYTVLEFNNYSVDSLARRLSKIRNLPAAKFRAEAKDTIFRWLAATPK